MDDPLLVRVMNGPARLDEQLQSRADRQSMAIAVDVDGLAVDEGHHQIGPSVGGHATVEEPDHEGMLEPTLQEFQPDVVGVTGYSMHVLRMLEICAIAKRRPRWKLSQSLRWS